MSMVQFSKEEKLRLKVVGLIHACGELFIWKLGFWVLEDLQELHFSPSHRCLAAKDMQYGFQWSKRYDCLELRYLVYQIFGVE
mgnify:CR=1 FL=1